MSRILGDSRYLECGIKHIALQISSIPVDMSSIQNPFNYKTINMKIRFIKTSGLFLSVLFVLLLSFGCKKNSSSSSNKYTISGNASSAQETTAVTSSGTGTVSGTYDANTNILQYNVSWSNLTGTATAAHFHGPAPAGQNAGVVVPFTLSNNGNAGTATGTATLTDQQETDLLAGNWYFNVHTAAYPGGEIRAQVVVSKQ